MTQDVAGAATPVTRPPVALYVHFPFCVSLCPYCDFVVYAGASARGPAARIDHFLIALRSEIAFRADVLDPSSTRTARRSRRCISAAAPRLCCRRTLWRLSSLSSGNGSASPRVPRSLWRRTPGLTNEVTRQGSLRPASPGCRWGRSLRRRRASSPRPPTSGRRRGRCGRRRARRRDQVGEHGPAV